MVIVRLLQSLNMEKESVWKAVGHGGPQGSQEAPGDAQGPVSPC